MWVVYRAFPRLPVGHWAPKPTQHLRTTLVTHVYAIMALVSTAARLDARPADCATPCRVRAHVPWCSHACREAKCGRWPLMTSMKDATRFQTASKPVCGACGAGGHLATACSVCSARPANPGSLPWGSAVCNAVCKRCFRMHNSAGMCKTTTCSSCTGMWQSGRTVLRAA